MLTFKGEMKDLGIRVDELLQCGPHVRPHFERMIVDCENAVEGILKEGKDPGVAGLPDSAMSLHQKYASLAALHDEVCKNSEPVSPYERRSSGKADLPRQKAIFNAIRQQSVRDLQPEHLPRLKRAFKDIVRDLASQGLLPDEGSGVDARAPSCDGKSNGIEPTEPIHRLTPMTDGQKRLWDALEGRALSAKQLASKDELDTSEDAVRQFKLGLKQSGYTIALRPGRGYYRPDAPPDESRNHLGST